MHRRCTVAAREPSPHRRCAQGQIRRRHHAVAAASPYTRSAAAEASRRRRWLDASEPLLVEPAPPLVGPLAAAARTVIRCRSDPRRRCRSRAAAFGPAPPLVGVAPPSAVLAPPSAWSNRAVAARRIPQPPPSASSPPQSSPPLVGPASAAAAARPDSSAAGRTSFGLHFLDIFTFYFSCCRC
ncbi:hypothetical protein Scep_014192 [Stephania cephalantha]|uniref:Uncharacterized protein n=1 Tax=Stephania cephalantha TaxID=152367 RepID=A0AAP0J0R5_9MAGN